SLLSAVKVQDHCAAAGIARDRHPMPGAIVDVAGGLDGGVSVTDAKRGLRPDQRHAKVIRYIGNFAIHQSLTAPPMGARATGLCGLDPEGDREAVLDRARDL